MRTGPDLSYNGAVDVFVAKVTVLGSGLVYCGYLGGTGYDSGAQIATDPAGNVYLTGSVVSGVFDPPQLPPT